jgi:hypothetical protein
VSEYAELSANHSRALDVGNKTHRASAALSSPITLSD